MWQYLIWIGVFVLALVVEGLTMQLVSIWFAVGALAGLIASFVTDSLTVQCTLFVLVSLVLFLCTRPLIKKWNKKPAVHTNADSVIGMEGVVKQEVNTLLGTGRVYVNGLSWAARSDAVIPVDTKITVLEMKGVTLTVRPSDTEA